MEEMDSSADQASWTINEDDANDIFEDLDFLDDVNEEPTESSLLVSTSNDCNDNVDPATGNDQEHTSSVAFLASSEHSQSSIPFLEDAAPQQALPLAPSQDEISVLARTIMEHLHKFKTAAIVPEALRNKESGECSDTASVVDEKAETSKANKQSKGNDGVSRVVDIDTSVLNSPPKSQCLRSFDLRNKLMRKTKRENLRVRVVQTSSSSCSPVKSSISSPKPKSTSKTWKSLGIDYHSLGTQVKSEVSMEQVENDLGRCDAESVIKKNSSNVEKKKKRSKLKAKEKKTKKRGGKRKEIKPLLASSAPPDVIAQVKLVPHIDSPYEEFDIAALDDRPGDTKSSELQFDILSRKSPLRTPLADSTADSPVSVSSAKTIRRCSSGDEIEQSARSCNLQAAPDSSTSPRAIHSVGDQPASLDKRRQSTNTVTLSTTSAEADIDDDELYRLKSDLQLELALSRSLSSSPWRKGKKTISMSPIADKPLSVTNSSLHRTSSDLSLVSSLSSKHSDSKSKRIKKSKAVKRKSRRSRSCSISDKSPQSVLGKESRTNSKKSSKSRSDTKSKNKKSRLQNRNRKSRSHSISGDSRSHSRISTKSRSRSRSRMSRSQSRNRKSRSHSRNRKSRSRSRNRKSRSHSSNRKSRSRSRNRKSRSLSRSKISRSGSRNQKTSHQKSRESRSNSTNERNSNTKVRKSSSTRECQGRTRKSSTRSRSKSVTRKPHKEILRKSRSPHDRKSHSPTYRSRFSSRRSHSVSSERLFRPLRYDPGHKRCTYQERPFPSKKKDYYMSPERRKYRSRSRSTSYERRRLPPKRKASRSPIRNMPVKKSNSITDAVSKSGLTITETLTAIATRPQTQFPTDAYYPPTTGPPFFQLGPPNLGYPPVMGPGYSQAYTMTSVRVCQPPGYIPAPNVFHQPPPMILHAPVSVQPPNYRPPQVPNYMYNPPPPRLQIYDPPPRLPVNVFPANPPRQVSPLISRLKHVLGPQLDGSVGDTVSNNTVTSPAACSFPTSVTDDIQIIENVSSPVSKIAINLLSGKTNISKNVEATSMVRGANSPVISQPIPYKVGNLIQIPIKKNGSEVIDLVDDEAPSNPVKNELSKLNSSNRSILTPSVALELLRKKLLCTKRSSATQVDASGDTTGNDSVENLNIEDEVNHENVELFNYISKILSDGM